MQIFQLLQIRNFNPRSRKGSDRYCSHRSASKIYFNPRSRKGSDEALDELNDSMKISIHAPAKGATLLVSNIRYSCLYFNPRSRKGSDALWIRRLPSTEISIHAPAKGATMKSGHVGVMERFQSTLPQRERRSRNIQNPV